LDDRLGWGKNHGFYISHHGLIVSNPFMTSFKMKLGDKPSTQRLVKKARNIGNRSKVETIGHVLYNPL
jgi:hypothetical protein